MPGEAVGSICRRGRRSRTSRCRTGGELSSRRARSAAKSADMPADQPTSSSGMNVVGSASSPGRKRHRSRTLAASMTCSRGSAASSSDQPDRHASVQ
eukprot:6397694-Heterocapsa_arctica.AAC.1